MLTASCHCGAIRLEVSRTPRTLTDCNCSICRRYGALWAYYKATSVRMLRAPKATSVYSWGDKTLEFYRCSVCGCVTHHERTRKRPDSTIGLTPGTLNQAPLPRRGSDGWMVPRPGNTSIEASIGTGYARSILGTLPPVSFHALEAPMKRVTGIGGIFFNAKDPVALRAWYKTHLGIDVQEWGSAAFRWTDEAG